VESGPITENILRGDKVNVRAFPAGHWHEHDGGPYIGTECLVINKDPDSDWINLGTYRTQVQDEKTLTVFIEPGKHGSIIREKYWAKGKPCPMVVCVGQAPILGVVASTASKHGVSELNSAGGRLGHPVKVIRGELTGLPIPAEAELAFEGFMPPPSEETRPEGPFAEWPGYYATDAGEEPVVRVGAGSRRRSRPSPGVSRASPAWRRSGTRWKRPACPASPACGSRSGPASAS